MTIEFGDWRLVPLDKLNWELYHRHAVTRGKTAGQVKWHPQGKYFSELGRALRYVWEYELRQRRGKEVVGLAEAMRLAEGIRDELLASADVIGQTGEVG